MHTLQGNEFVLFYLRLHPNDPCHSLFDQFWQQHMLCIHLSVSGMRNFKRQFSSVKNVKLRLIEPLVKLFANKSLEFVLNGCFRKIFRTTSAEVVQNCMLVFNCLSMQECVAKRKCKFLANYVKSDNILCYVCQNTYAHELNMLDKRWLFYFVVYIS